MDLSEESRKREKLRTILLELAASQDVLKEENAISAFCRRFENLYHSANKSEQYHHFYCDIFPLLTQIYQGDCSGSIDILGQNLELLRRSYRSVREDEQGNRIDIKDNLRKLYDHVSLEIARITYTGSYFRQAVNVDQIDQIKYRIETLSKDTLTQQVEFENKVSEYDSKICEYGERITSFDDKSAKFDEKVFEINTKLTETEKKIDKTKEKLDKSERDYIAILGIFSSVVLTFTAGIAFSTSVLYNISQVSIYRLIGTALVIGLVLINILFVMFHFTGKLVKNDVPLEPFEISNGIFIGLLIVVVIAWWVGCVEQRNSRIEGQSIPSSSVVAVTSSSFESKEPEIDQLSEQ